MVAASLLWPQLSPTGLDKPEVCLFTERICFISVGRRAGPSLVDLTQLESALSYQLRLDTGSKVNEFTDNISLEISLTRQGRV